MTVIKILPQQQSTLEDRVSAARIWRDLKVQREEAPFFLIPYRARDQWRSGLHWQMCQLIWTAK